MTGAVTSSRGPCSAGSAVKRRASRWLAVFVLAPLLLTCLPPAQAPAYAVAGACVPATSPAYAPLPVPASEAQPTGTPSPATSLVEAEGLQLWTRFPARGAK